LSKSNKINLYISYSFVISFLKNEYEIPNKFDNRKKLIIVPSLIYKALPLINVIPSIVIKNTISKPLLTVDNFFLKISPIVKHKLSKGNFTIPMARIAPKLIDDNDSPIKKTIIL